MPVGEDAGVELVAERIVLAVDGPGIDEGAFEEVGVAALEVVVEGDERRVGVLEQLAHDVDEHVGHVRGAAAGGEGDDELVGQLGAVGHPGPGDGVGGALFLVVVGQRLLLPRDAHVGRQPRFHSGVLLGSSGRLGARVGARTWARAGGDRAGRGGEHAGAAGQQGATGARPHGGGTGWSDQGRGRERDRERRHSRHSRHDGYLAETHGAWRRAGRQPGGWNRRGGCCVPLCPVVSGATRSSVATQVGHGAGDWLASGWYCLILVVICSFL